MSEKEKKGFEKQEAAKDDLKTVLKQPDAVQETLLVPIQPSKVRPNKKTALSPSQELTQISESMRSQKDNSQGFLKARKAADKALASNKIVLNKRFVLEATLGSGGMGTVYRAKDLRKVEANDINTEVAVKVLGDDFKHHPDAFMSLQREASRSHMLSHPNIVTVHDFDRDGDLIYMTMELLKGKGLDALLRESSVTGLPVDEALAIISDYCKALSYAHKKHIIHSDLKPGNIFIAESGAKVLDFGIARIASKSHPQEDFDAGSLGAMTPAYASLEMLNFEAPDPSDDVYAAAIIAYELFSGEHPYGRKPADKALAEGLKPKRLEQLSKQQWQALEAALKLRRSERTTSIDSFIDGLTQTNKIPVFQISSAVFLCIIGWLSYQFLYAPDKLEGVIETTLGKANQCYEEQNNNCVIESAKAVLKMFPGHIEAQSLLENSERDLLRERIDLFVSQAEQCLAADKDTACARVSLRDLQKLASNSMEFKALSDKIALVESQQAVKKRLDEAQACLESKDFGCAIEQLDLALLIDNDNLAARKLLSKIMNEKSKRDAELLHSKQRFDALMSSANGCFSNKNYACVISKADQALKIKPSSSEAASIKQQAVFAERQWQESISKAKGLLEKSKACLAKKNYSCTIANAESALAFIPGYAPAFEIKRTANKELEYLKKNFTLE